MVFSSLKPVGPLPPVAVTKESQIKRRRELTVVKRALQVRSEGMLEQQQPSCPTALTTSRRDVMACMTAASLAATTLFSTVPAEARIVKPEIRQKIMEKLQKLREKAGLSKLKIENRSSAADKDKAPPPPPKKESSPSSNPQNSPIGPLVETTLPK